MKLAEVLKMNLVVVQSGDDKFERLSREVCEAIKSQATYPWNVTLENADYFVENESFNKAISVKEVYSMHFGSDEDALMRILLLDDVEFAIIQKNGDTRQWSWTLLSEDLEQKAIAFFSKIDNELREEHDTSDFINDEQDHYSQYLTMSIVEGLLVIENFNGFAWALEGHSVPKFALLKSDPFISVNVKSWIPYESYKDKGLITIEQDGQKREIEINELYFIPR